MVVVMVGWCRVVVPDPTLGMLLFGGWFNLLGGPRGTGGLNLLGGPRGTGGLNLLGGRGTGGFNLLGGLIN